VRVTVEREETARLERPAGESVIEVMAVRIPIDLDRHALPSGLSKTSSQRARTP
jgi:hypothetical protein